MSLLAEDSAKRQNTLALLVTPAVDELAESLSISVRDFLDLGFAGVGEDECRGRVLVATALCTRIIVTTCQKGNND